MSMLELMLSGKLEVLPSCWYVGPSSTSTRCNVDLKFSEHYSVFGMVDSDLSSPSLAEVILDYTVILVRNLELVFL